MSKNVSHSHKPGGKVSVQQYVVLPWILETFEEPSFKLTLTHTLLASFANNNLIVRLLMLSIGAVE